MSDTVCEWVMGLLLISLLLCVLALIVFMIVGTITGVISWTDTSICVEQAKHVFICQGGD